MIPEHCGEEGNGVLTPSLANKRYCHLSSQSHCVALASPELAEVHLLLPPTCLD